MRGRGILLVIGLGWSLVSAAQLRLEECQEKARAHYPMLRQQELVERAGAYGLSNAWKSWLPQAVLSGKATLQSDVTRIPIDFSQVPGLSGLTIPSLSKDQYGTTLEVSQSLWDGGMSEAKRQTVRAEVEVGLAEVEVGLYAIRERVTELYFGVLLCDAMLAQQRLFAAELGRDYERVTALEGSGLATHADRDAVRVEQLRVEQSLAEVRYGRKAYLSMLSVYIGEALSEEVVLERPEEGMWVVGEIRRPELKMFDAQLSGVAASRRELDASLWPRLGLFVTGGYGKPGLNMLEDAFSAYYVGGVRLTWSLGGFYTRRNNLRLLETRREGIEVQRETFLFNTSVGRTGKEDEIAKYRELLRTDDEIIALRESVRRSSEVKMSGGTLTATDWMRDVTAEQLARQNKIVHEIEMLHAIYKLKFITNN